MALPANSNAHYQYTWNVMFKTVSKLKFTCTGEVLWYNNSWTANCSLGSKQEWWYFWKAELLWVWLSMEESNFRHFSKKHHLNFLQANSVQFIVDGYLYMGTVNMACWKLYMSSAVLCLPRCFCLNVWKNKFHISMGELNDVSQYP